MPRVPARRAGRWVSINRNDAEETTDGHGYTRKWWMGKSDLRMKGDPSFGECSSTSRIPVSIRVHPCSSVFESLFCCMDSDKPERCRRKSKASREEGEGREGGSELRLLTLFTVQCEFALNTFFTLLRQLRVLRATLSGLNCMDSDKRAPVRPMKEAALAVDAGPVPVSAHLCYDSDLSSHWWRRFSS